MNNRLIITLPITPYGEMSAGKMITPILGESLAKSMNCKFIMSINEFDCFKKRDSEPFIKLMNNYHIAPYNYWIDKQHIDKLIANVYYLINNGYIIEKEKELLCCKCGRVEISKDNLCSINYKDSLLEQKSNSYYCRFCKSQCSVKVEKVLVFDSRMVDKSHMRFYPLFINKDKITFDKTVGHNDVIISRKRNTGVSILYNGYSYNIDVDFLWETFLSLFSEEEKIVICGNRQLFQLYMVGMLEKCFTKDSKTICLATPYLISNNCELELEDKIMSLKVFDLLVLKWAKKDNTFDVSLLNYINSMSVEKKQMLYDILIEEIETTSDISKDLEMVLKRKYNFQNSSNELKRRRRNV